MIANVPNRARSGVRAALNPPVRRKDPCFMYPESRIGFKSPSPSSPSLSKGRGRPRRPRGIIKRAVDSVFEPLESRQMFSVSAISAAGVLVVIGDQNANAITVSRDAAGKLLVKGGAVRVLGNNPTVANTRSIELFGLGGDDTLTL